MCKYARTISICMYHINTHANLGTQKLPDQVVHALGSCLVEQRPDAMLRKPGGLLSNHLPSG